jgi:hypothetical protein
MAFESFVGLLYAGISGAIIFARIARIQSIANVMFSSPICVRYGTGVVLPTTDSLVLSEEDSVDRSEDCMEMTYPVLEFRLINDMSGVKGGEIVNARVSVVATTIAKKEEGSSSEHESFGRDLQLSQERLFTPVKTAMTAAKSVGTASTHAAQKMGAVSTQAAMAVGVASAYAAKSTGAALLGASKMASQAKGNIIQKINHTLSRPQKTSFLTDNEDMENLEFEPYNQKIVEAELEKAIEAKLLQKLARARAKNKQPPKRRPAIVVLDEGNAALAPALIFHQLNIETDRHPFMKRVWTIQHVLDASSPLISHTARSMIEQNNGCWPRELNNYEAIRKHLHFHEIIVNFSGTANVSGSTVFAVKVYEFFEYVFVQDLSVDVAVCALQSSMYIFTSAHQFSLLLSYYRKSHHRLRLRASIANIPRPKDSGRRRSAE